MKQNFTLAYLSHLAGERETVPEPAAYRRIQSDGTTAALTDEEASAIRSRVDALTAEITNRREP